MSDSPEFKAARAEYRRLADGLRCGTIEETPENVSACEAARNLFESLKPAPVQQPWLGWWSSPVFASMWLEDALDVERRA